MFFVPGLHTLLQFFDFFFKHKSSPATLLIRSACLLNSFLEWIVWKPTIEDLERFGTPINKFGWQHDWAMIREVSIQCLLSATKPFGELLWRNEESVQLAPNSSVWSKPSEFSSQPWRFIYLQFFNPFIELIDTTFPYLPLTYAQSFRWISDIIKISQDTP